MTGVQDLFGPQGPPQGLGPREREQLRRQLLKDLADLAGESEQEILAQQEEAQAEAPPLDRQLDRLTRPEYQAGRGKENYVQPMGLQQAVSEILQGGGPKAKRTPLDDELIRIQKTQGPPAQLPEDQREISQIVQRISSEVAIEKRMRDAQFVAAEQAAIAAQQITGQQDPYAQAFQTRIDQLMDQVMTMGSYGKADGEGPPVPHDMAMRKLQDEIGGLAIVDPDRGGAVQAAFQANRELADHFQQSKDTFRAALEAAKEQLAEPQGLMTILSGAFEGLKGQEALPRDQQLELFKQLLVKMQMGEIDRSAPGILDNISSGGGALGSVVGGIFGGPEGAAALGSGDGSRRGPPGPGELRDQTGHTAMLSRSGQRRGQPFSPSLYDPETEAPQPISKETWERALRDDVETIAADVFGERDEQTGQHKGVAPSDWGEEMASRGGHLVGSVVHYLGLGGAAKAIGKSVVGPGVASFFTKKLGEKATRFLAFESSVTAGAIFSAASKGPTKSQQIQINKLPMEDRLAAQAAAVTENMLVEAIAGPIFATLMPGGTALGRKIAGEGAGVLKRTVAGTVPTATLLPAGMEASSYMAKVFKARLEDDPSFAEGLRLGLVTRQPPGPIQQIVEALARKDWEGAKKAALEYAKQVRNVVGGLGAVVALGSMSEVVNQQGRWTKDQAEVVKEIKDQARKDTEEVVREIETHLREQMQGTGDRYPDVYGPKEPLGPALPEAEGPPIPEGEGPPLPPDFAARARRQLNGKVDAIMDDVMPSKEDVAKADLDAEVDKATGGRGAEAVKEAHKAEEIGGEEAPTTLGELAEVYRRQADEARVRDADDTLAGRDVDGKALEIAEARAKAADAAARAAGEVGGVRTKKTGRAQDEVMAYSWRRYADDLEAWDPNSGQPKPERMLFAEAKQKYLGEQLPSDTAMSKGFQRLQKKVVKAAKDKKKPKAKKLSKKEVAKAKVEQERKQAVAELPKYEPEAYDKPIGPDVLRQRSQMAEAPRHVKGEALFALEEAVRERGIEKPVPELTARDFTGPKGNRLNQSHPFRWAAAAGGKEKMIDTILKRHGPEELVRVRDAMERMRQELVAKETSGKGKVTPEAYDKPIGPDDMQGPFWPVPPEIAARKGKAASQDRLARMNEMLQERKEYKRAAGAREGVKAEAETPIPEQAKVTPDVLRQRSQMAEAARRKAKPGEEPKGEFDVLKGEFDVFKEDLAKAKTEGQANQVALKAMDSPNLTQAQKDDIAVMVSNRMRRINGEPTERERANEVEDALTRNGEEPENRYQELEDLTPTELRAHVNMPEKLPSGTKVAKLQFINDHFPETLRPYARKALAGQPNLKSPHRLFAEAVWLREWERDAFRGLSGDEVASLKKAREEGRAKVGAPGISAGEAVTWWRGVLEQFKLKLDQDTNPVTRARSYQALMDFHLPKAFNVLAEVYEPAAELRREMMQGFHKYVVEAADRTGGINLLGFGFSSIGLPKDWTAWFSQRSINRLNQWLYQANEEIAKYDEATGSYRAGRLGTLMGWQPMGWRVEPGKKLRRVRSFIPMATVAAIGGVLGGGVPQAVAGATAAMIFGGGPWKGHWRNFMRTLARATDKLGFLDIESPLSKWGSHAMEMNEAMAYGDQLLKHSMVALSALLKRADIKESDFHLVNFTEGERSHVLGRLLEQRPWKEGAKKSELWDKADQDMKDAAIALGELHDFYRDMAAKSSDTYWMLEGDRQRLEKALGEATKESSSFEVELKANEDAVKADNELSTTRALIEQLTKESKSKTKKKAKAARKSLKLAEKTFRKDLAKRGLEDPRVMTRRASQRKGRVTKLENALERTTTFIDDWIDGWGIDGYRHMVPLAELDTGAKWWRTGEKRAVDILDDWARGPREDLAAPKTGAVKKRTGKLGAPDPDAVRSTAIYLQRIIPYITMQRALHRQSKQLFGEWRNLDETETKLFYRGFDTLDKNVGYGLEEATIRAVYPGRQVGGAEPDLRPSLKGSRFVGSVGAVIEFEGRLYKPREIPKEVRKKIKQLPKSERPEVEIGLVRQLEGKDHVQQSESWMNTHQGEIFLFPRRDIRDLVHLQKGGFYRTARAARRKSLDAYHEALLKPWKSAIGLADKMIDNPQNNAFMRNAAAALNGWDRFARMSAYWTGSALTGLFAITTGVTAMTGAFFLNAMQLGALDAVKALGDSVRFGFASAKARKGQFDDAYVNMIPRGRGGDFDIHFADMPRSRKAGEAMYPNDPEMADFVSWLHGAGLMTNTKDFSYFAHHHKWEPAVKVDPEKLAQKLGKSVDEITHADITPDVLTADVIIGGRYMTKGKWGFPRAKGRGHKEAAWAGLSHVLNKTLEGGYFFMKVTEAAARFGQATRAYKRLREGGKSVAEARRGAFDAVVLSHGLFNRAMRSKFFLSGTGMMLGAVTTWLNHAVGVYQRLPDAQKRRVWAATYLTAMMSTTVGVDAIEWLFGFDDDTMESKTKREVTKGFRQDVSIAIGSNVKEMPFGERIQHILLKGDWSPFALIDRVTNDAYGYVTREVTGRQKRSRLFDAGIPTPTMAPTFDTAVARSLKLLGDGFIGATWGGRGFEYFTKRAKTAARSILVPASVRYTRKALAEERVPGSPEEGFEYTPLFGDRPKNQATTGIVRMVQDWLPGWILNEAAEQLRLDEARIEDERQRGVSQRAGDYLKNVLKDRIRMAKRKAKGEDPGVLAQESEDLTGQVGRFMELAKEAKIDLRGSKGWTYWRRQFKRALAEESGLRRLSTILNAPRKPFMVNRLIDWVADEEAQLSASQLHQAEAIIKGQRDLQSWFDEQPYDGDASLLPPKARMLHERARAAGTSVPAYLMYRVVKAERFRR